MSAHKSIKKTTTFLLIVFTCTFLISCTEESEVNNYVNDYAYSNDETHDNETDDNTISTDVSNILQIVFTGETVQRDNLHWSEERDRNWEVDVRQFAVFALRHHPLLIDFDDIGLVEDRTSGDYSRYMHSAILSRVAGQNGILSNDNVAMRESLRELFIEKTNALIINIPNFSDYEIIFSLSEVSALLGDGHTQVAFLFGRGRVFPVDIRALYDGVYLTGVPKEFERALYAELLAIGGVPIDEVIERFSRVVPHENEYYLRRAWIPRLLTVVELLMFIDVVCDSGTAEFRVRCVSGEIFDITIEALDNRDALATMRETEFVSYGANTLMYMRPDEFMWHEYFYEESIMYVRIRSFDITAAAITAAAIELRTELRNWQDDEMIETFIVDLRGNRGGHALWPSGEDINFLAERVSNLYVIIDGGSYSQSVMTASNLRYRMDNIAIIGEPAGQPDSFFVSALGNLPNSRLRYQVSNGMWVGSNNTDTALRPDPLIPLTITDIINQHDPVLEYIKAR